MVINVLKAYGACRKLECTGWLVKIALNSKIYVLCPEQSLQLPRYDTDFASLTVNNRKCGTLLKESVTILLDSGKL